MPDLSLSEEEYHFTLSFVMWQMHDKAMWLQNLFCFRIMVLDVLVVMVLVGLCLFLYL